MNENVLPLNFPVESYSLFRDAALEKAGSFAPTVPAVPDRMYTIIKNADDGALYVLVTTDHPSPAHDSEELYVLSGKYSFKELVGPAGEIIPVREDDDMDDDFFVKNEATYYYVALVQR